MSAEDQTDILVAVKIIVTGSFSPRAVVLAAGRRHRLVFRREETSPCSERVVLPSLGKSVDLPPFEDVELELPELAPGSHPMTCRRGVLYGRIMVRDDERTAA